MSTTGTFKDFAANLVTSGYKWLTSTLLAAQQQFAVRPYFTAQIIDDTIQPNAQLFNGTGAPVGRGGMVLAPDGSMLAVGYNGSGNLVFYKAPDLNASAGVFPTTVVLDTSGTLVNSQAQACISVSDWYNGSYQIDIWYFRNFGSSGTNLVLVNQWSTDGGATWSSFTPSIPAMPNTNYPTDNLSIAAAQTRLINGNMSSGCFFIKPNSHTFNSTFTGYDIFYTFGNHSTGFSSGVQWSYFNADSFDWTIQGVTAFYLNNVQYVAFSGFHNVLNTPGVNANFSIWVTALLTQTGSTATDLWSQPVPVMPIGSTNALNQNSFINPMATVSNNMAYIIMEAIQVDSISQTAQGTTSAVVTTHTNYMLIQSDDGNTFSYPSVMVFTDGTEFNSNSTACFVPQANYWYLGGSAGYLWQFVQNNIVADVTQDVIGYSISEQAGQPSSINLQIGNANNKWVGAAPTGPGAAAIARNRKIALYQGYYNANGIPETVPRNIYFIDDIQQSVSGTDNSVTLVARDLFKKMKTTVSRYNYQFVGPIFYTDIFDGTTNGNWNQIAGTWKFDLSGGAAPNAVDGLNSGAEATLMLNNAQFNTSGHTMRVFFQATHAGTVIVYGMYIDPNNWLRLEIDTFHSTWAVKKNVNSSTTTIDSGSLPTALVTTNFYMVLVKRFIYWDFNFFFAPAGGVGNELSTYDPSAQSYFIKNSSNGDYSIQGDISSTPSMQVPFAVGVGASASVSQRFKYFQLAIYNNSNNVGEITRVFARLAGIFTFKLVYTFRELMYTATQFANTFSIKNRILTIPASIGFVMSTINPVSNGEIAFRAKLTPTVSATATSFGFLFRANNAGSPTANYYFRLIKQGGTGAQPIVCRFERLFSGIRYYFYNSAEDIEFNPAFTGTSLLNFDPSVYHDYRIVMIDGQMQAFIDNVMVAAWNDDNTTSNFLASGYWGFETDGNTTLFVKSIKAPILWKPVPSVAFNPGDDIESDLTALATSLKFWFFSDLFGRFKSLFLSSTDQANYTYDNQLYQQNVDESDKEYISQVTVYGSGVSATARNTTLMAGVPVREMVIVDYTILTQADAQTRATYELVNANQYLNQNQSTQVINVGAELFDVVTVINTGNNTSGVNSPTRVYDQTINQGGGNNNSDYSLEIDTGNV